jgi:hypothetical protein
MKAAVKASGGNSGAVAGNEVDDRKRKVVLDVRVVQIDTRNSCLKDGTTESGHGGGRAKWTPAPGLLRSASWGDDENSPSSHHGHFAGHPQFYPPRANSAQIGALPQNANLLGHSDSWSNDVDGEWSVQQLSLDTVKAEVGLMVDDDWRGPLTPARSNPVRSLVDRIIDRAHRELLRTYATARDWRD